MNIHGVVVLCLSGGTCLIWIFVMIAVVCGEIVSFPHSYILENLICIKYLLERCHYPCYLLDVKHFFSCSSLIISLVIPISKSYVPFYASDGKHYES
jgi:hypothetical protein